MVAGRDLAAVRAPYRVDVEGVGPVPAAGDALLDGGHDVAEEGQVPPVKHLKGNHACNICAWYIPRNLEHFKSSNPKGRRRKIPNKQLTSIFIFLLFPFSNIHCSPPLIVTIFLPAAEPSFIPDVAEIIEENYHG